MGKILIDAIGYLGYLLEAGLLVYIFARGHAKRVPELVFYLVASLGLNLARLYSLHRYGFSSWQFSYCYWTTDLLLVFTAFIVVSALFRRACPGNPRLWEHLRLLLGTVFVLVAALSFFSLAGHDGRIFSFFIVEFSQNLYFACLVLITLLYLMTLKMEIADERLGLLVCGLGIEFAGPAASLAFYYLTGGNLGSSLGVYFFPLCDIGMILTWFYAISRVPGAAKAPRSRVPVGQVFAEENGFHS
jgi:hypothetical protein